MCVKLFWQGVLSQEKNDDVNTETSKMWVTSEVLEENLVSIFAVGIWEGIFLNVFQVCQLQTFKTAIYVTIITVLFLLCV